MRGGDKGGGGYGGSGKGNSGPGAGGARGGAGSPGGGIGGTGIGWSGSGAESRSAAAHAGANVGRSGGSSSRGPGSSVGAGRRSDALGAFGAVSRGVANAFGGLSSAFGGLTEGLANTLGGLTGVGQKDKATTLGQVGWKGPGTESRAKAGFQDAQTGFGLAKGVQLSKAVAGPFGLSAPVEAVGDVTAKSMTPDAQRAYNSAMDARSSLTSGVSLAAKAAGIPAGPATNMANLADLSAVVGHIEGYNPDTPARSPAADRRSNALAAFGGSGSSATNALTPQTPQYGLLKGNWEPASYGVGDYGSHIKGLLS